MRLAGNKGVCLTCLPEVVRHRQTVVIFICAQNPAVPPDETPAHVDLLWDLFRDLL